MSDSDVKFYHKIEHPALSMNPLKGRGKGFVARLRRDKAL